jgi:hypothetical protein
MWLINSDFSLQPLGEFYKSDPLLASASYSRHLLMMGFVSSGDFVVVQTWQSVFTQAKGAVSPGPVTVEDHRPSYVQFTVPTTGQSQAYDCD